MTSESSVLLTDIKQPETVSEAVSDGKEQKQKQKSIARIFAGQLTDAVTLLLLAAGTVSAVAGAFSDALPIMLMALLNTAAGFVGEYRSERTLRRIAELTDREADLSSETPLTQTTDRIAGVLTAAAFGGAAVCFLLSMIRGAGLADSFYFSASLLIAAVPLGIRSVCLIACSSAMERSLKSGAAICSCSAVEKLAAAGTLCIGKSGILTDGYVSAAALAVMSGSGCKEYKYSEAEGRLTIGASEDGFHAWEDSALSRVLICAAVCSNAKRVRTEPRSGSRDRGRRSFYDGDPCETALLRLCSACGIERGLLLCERLSEKPFDPESGYMQVTVREADGRVVSYIKGAPEAVALICGGVGEAADSFCEKYGSLGLGLMAFGMNDGSGWKYLGLAALRESLRPRCAENVRRLRRLGVRTVLLSGDHPKTAAAAAARAGILTPDSLAVNSTQLQRMTDGELYDSVRSISLVSRATEEQRVRVMSALQSRGVRCAFASAVPPEAADVRISATDKSSDIILTNGGISAMTQAVSECRAVYVNILRTVSCMISSEVGILLTVTGAAAMGMPAAFKSCYLLLAALLCGSFPALLLSSAPASETMSSPRRADELFGGGAIAESVGRGVLTALCTLGCCSLLLGGGYPTEAVRSASLLTLVISNSMVFASHAQKLPAAVRAAGIITPVTVIITLMTVPELSRIFSLTFPGVRPSATAFLLAATLPVVKKLRYYAEKRVSKK